MPSIGTASPGASPATTQDAVRMAMPATTTAIRPKRSTHHPTTGDRAYMPATWTLMTSPISCRVTSTCAMCTGRHDHHHDHDDVADGDRRDAEQRARAAAQVLDAVAQPRADDVLAAALAMGDRGEVRDRAAGRAAAPPRSAPGSRPPRRRDRTAAAGPWPCRASRTRSAGSARARRRRSPAHTTQDSDAGAMLLGREVGRRVPGLVAGGGRHPDEEAAEQHERQAAQHGRDDHDDGAAARRGRTRSPGPGGVRGRARSARAGARAPRHRARRPSARGRRPPRSRRRTRRSASRRRPIRRRRCRRRPARPTGR